MIRGLRAAAAVALASMACNAVLGNEDRVLRQRDAGGSDGTILDEDAGGEDVVVKPPDARGDASGCEGVCLVVSAFQPQQVAVVDGVLYYSQNGGPGAALAWCPVDDCKAPSTFYFDTGSFGLHVDDTGIAVVSPSANRVATFPLRYDGANGQNELATSLASPPIGVTMDAANLYFTTANGGVYRCARAGCGGSPTLVSQGTAPGGSVAVGGGKLVWGSAATGGTPGTCGAGCLQQVAPDAVSAPPLEKSFGRQPRMLQMTGARLIWTATGGPSGYQGEVSKRDNGLESQTESFYARELGEPWAVAVDATHVYFTVESAGTINRCPLGGCLGAPEVIATGQAQPRGIAIDDGFVYWASYGAGIMRMKK